MNSDIIKNFKIQMERELKDNILNFWIDNAQDNENGGFYGFISDDLKVRFMASGSGE